MPYSPRRETANQPMKALRMALNRIASTTAIILVRLYQWTISPLLPTNCRYTPTCSNYMIGAIREWGALKGVWLGIKRISRCHPCGGWGEDAVPEKEKNRKGRESAA